MKFLINGLVLVIEQMSGDLPTTTHRAAEVVSMGKCPLGDDTDWSDCADYASDGSSSYGSAGSGPEEGEDQPGPTQENLQLPCGPLPVSRE